MSFRLVPKSVTLNDIERRNGVIFRYFSEFGSLLDALRKSSRSLSNILISSCINSGVKMLLTCRAVECYITHYTETTP